MAESRLWCSADSQARPAWPLPQNEAHPTMHCVSLSWLYLCPPQSLWLPFTTPPPAPRPLTPRCPGSRSRVLSSASLVLICFTRLSLTSVLFLHLFPLWNASLVIKIILPKGLKKQGAASLGSSQVFQRGYCRSLMPW